MRAFQTLLMYVCLVGAFALTAWCIALVWGRQIALVALQLLDKWRRLGNFGRVLLVTFVTAMIVYGSTKTNAMDNAGGMTTNAPMAGLAMGAGDVAGLPSRTTAVRGAVPQPGVGLVSTNAVLARDWWFRGGWEDWLTIQFDDGWRFPHGDGHLTKVTVMSQGALRTCLSDTNEIATLGVPLAMVPFKTVFTHEHTSSNSQTFTWRNAFANRDTNALVNAKIELFRNGDKCITTNGVATLIPRVLPFPSPGIGQGEEWVRSNFWNAAEILDVGYAAWVDEQVGIDQENGLYRFTATFSVAPPEATQLTVGDLSVVVANAGEYVFLLEKGAEYTFGTTPCDATVEYSMQDDVALDAPVFTSWWGGDSAGLWTVDGGWHEINLSSIPGYGTCLWMPTLRGSPDVMHISPGDSPVTFEALLSDYLHADEVTYQWTSSDDVYIACPAERITDVVIESFPSWGNLSLSVTTEVCGRELFSTLFATMGTNSAPTPAGVSVSFSKSAILFEREYETGAGVYEPSRSDSSVLHCSASGGELGGTARFYINKKANLVKESGPAFPIVKRLEPGEDYSFDVVYRGVSPSDGIDDITVTGEFRDEDGNEYRDRSKLTVVEVETEVSCPWIPYSQRKRLGVREGMDIRLIPVEAEFTAVFGKCQCANSQWYYLAPSRGCTDSLPIRFRDSELVLEVTVLEPEAIVAGACQTSSSVGPGQAGGFVGEFTVCVCPTNVSFTNIETMEVPSVSTDATGYFAQNQYSGLWDHGQHGAGIWHGVGRENHFIDRAGYKTELPMPWNTGGSFSWMIENAWRTADQPAATNLLSHLVTYDQYFELSEDGTASIRKFGYCISRGTNCVMTVSRSGL